MNYRELTDEELLSQMSTVHNVEANEEWAYRYGMNIPYRLDKFGRILNCLSWKVMYDWECDKMIRRQANEVRTVKKLSTY